MAYVFDGRKLIKHAFEHKYTLPAFNVCSVEMIRACIEAAEETQAPIIVQTYPADIAQIDVHQAVALVKSYAERASVPILLHMDHGPNYETDFACLSAGYGSIMYDGADAEIDDIIVTTKKVVEAAHIAGAAVEVAAESFNHGMVEYSKAEDCLRLFEEGGADMVAISVGSEHGQTGSLRAELMRDIAALTKKPLVLHGGSGISSEDHAIGRECGVVKCNIGSALYRSLRKTWEDSADAQNHREVYERVRAALKDIAKHYIEIMNAAGQAASYN